MGSGSGRTCLPHEPSLQRSCSERHKIQPILLSKKISKFLNPNTKVSFSHLDLRGKQQACHLWDLIDHSLTLHWQVTAQVREPTTCLGLLTKSRPFHPRAPRGSKSARPEGKAQPEANFQGVKRLFPACPVLVTWGCQAVCAAWDPSVFAVSSLGTSQVLAQDLCPTPYMP